MDGIQLPVPCTPCSKNEAHSFSSLLPCLTLVSFRLFLFSCVSVSPLVLPTSHSTPHELPDQTGELGSILKNTLCTVLTRQLNQR